MNPLVSLISGSSWTPIVRLPYDMKIFPAWQLDEIGGSGGPDLDQNLCRAFDWHLGGEVPSANPRPVVRRL